MPEYDEMLMDTIDNETIEASEKNEVSADYPVLAKSDDGDTFYAVKESFRETYENPEKSSIGGDVVENVEIFTKDGKEYLGIRKENMTSTLDPFLDKFSVTFYPDEGKHNVYTSGSELSEIYKGIDVPEDLISKWTGSEASIEMEDVTQNLDTEFTDDDATLLGM